jgi:hypothetical protein
LPNRTQGRPTSTSGNDQALSGRRNRRWRNQLIVASRRQRHAVFLHTGSE